MFTLNERKGLFDPYRRRFPDKQQFHLLEVEGRAVVAYIHIGGQERLLVCGFDDSGSLDKTQLLITGQKDKGEDYYFVHLGDELKHGVANVLERKPEGCQVNPQLVANMRSMVKKRIECQCGFYPVDYRQAASFLEDLGVLKRPKRRL